MEPLLLSPNETVYVNFTNVTSFYTRTTYGGYTISAQFAQQAISTNQVRGDQPYAASMRNFSAVPNLFVHLLFFAMQIFWMFGACPDLTIAWACSDAFKANGANTTSPPTQCNPCYLDL